MKPVQYLSLRVLNGVTLPNCTGMTEMVALALAQTPALMQPQARRVKRIQTEGKWTDTQKQTHRSWPE